MVRTAEDCVGLSPGVQGHELGDQVITSLHLRPCCHLITAEYRYGFVRFDVSASEITWGQTLNLDSLKPAKIQIVNYPT